MSVLSINLSTSAVLCLAELKEVTEKVNDYCSLMKDFPLQDLLAANSLDSIRAAISAIFQHMRRIRNTSYPPGRVMHLLEAVSRDILAQMTKVCLTELLMSSCDRLACD